MQKVVSKDGTELAYDTYGSGPVLVLVAGGFTERSRYVDDAKALSSAFTVVNHDRRGRGDSGDTLPYAVEREWEDLEAIRSAVAGITPQQMVGLWQQAQRQVAATQEADSTKSE